MWETESRDDGWWDLPRNAPFCRSAGDFIGFGMLLMAWTNFGYL